MAANPGVIAGGEIENRPEPARIADTRAVEVTIIERAAKLGMVIHVKIGMAKLEEPAHGALRLARGDVLGMIGIGHVGAGGGEEGDLPAVSPFARCDKEGDVVLARRRLITFARADMEGVRAAWEIGGNLD